MWKSSLFSLLGDCSLSEKGGDGLLKVNPVDIVDWIFNEAWTAIMIGAVILILFLALIYLGVHNLRELQRINDVFATILLCEDEIELPKDIALEVVNGAFRSKITEEDLVVDIYENPEKENWVNLIARNDGDEKINHEGLIATATEKNFGIIILKHLL